MIPESYADMHFSLACPPVRRGDRRLIRICLSRESIIRVTVDEPPATNIYLQREAYYTKDEIHLLGGNLEGAMKRITNAWVAAGEEYFQDPSLRPLDEQLLKSAEFH